MRRASSSATLPAPPLDAEAAERRREYRSHGLQHSARASVELPVFVHLESPVLHYRDARSRGIAAAPRAASGFGATVDRDGGAAHGVVPSVRRRRSAASRDGRVATAACDRTGRRRRERRPRGRPGRCSRLGAGLQPARGAGGDGAQTSTRIGKGARRSWRPSALPPFPTPLVRAVGSGWPLVDPSREQGARYAASGRSRRGRAPRFPRFAPGAPGRGAS